MAENNEYVITIDISGLPSGSGAVAGEKNVSTPGSDNSAGALQSVAQGFKTIKKATFGIVSYATAKSFADQIIGYEISQVSLETGASEYEQRLNAKYGIVNDVVGAGVSLLAGFATAGPAGLAVAAAGIIISGVHKVVNIAQREQTLQTNADLENISISMQRRRAGFNGSRTFNG